MARPLLSRNFREQLANNCEPISPALLASSPQRGGVTQMHQNTPNVDEVGVNPELLALLRRIALAARLR
jgi:hypothetical protein